ncbi:MAG: hypothetical protein QOE22_295 [Candidatus Parcubacteria bacterium]|jgi:GNAT superfamily N-acetyltransferase|nr:hypothetical protein [Candidatus Parcubacteria bacterium]
MKSELMVRLATGGDLEAIASINAKVFLGDRDNPAGALAWATSLQRAFPIYQYFLVEIDGTFAGYAGWQAHGGLHRAEPVIELDQLGIDPRFQGKGWGGDVIDACMHELTEWVLRTNDRIESHINFVVWGYAFNLKAIKLYKRKFGRKVCGSRTQFGDRRELMFRKRVPVVRSARDE